MRGKTVIVTGASSGIGAAAARRFAESGAEVAVVGRSESRTAAVAAGIGAEGFTADFTRLDDVRSLARVLLDRYERIDVLANNAGRLFPADSRTADGHEATFQVNHLAPFLLTTLLLGRLTAAPGARVINTGSAAFKTGRLDLDDLDHERRRSGTWQTYADSKVATLLFTGELARRTEGTGLVTACFHPGPVATHVFRHGLFGVLGPSWLARKILLSPEQGAEPLVRLATTGEDVNGGYFNRFKREALRHRQANDLDLASRLWDRSAELTDAPIGLPVASVRAASDGPRRPRAPAAPAALRRRTTGSGPASGS